MKAAILIAPEKLIIQDVPEPVLGDYDALCDILAAAVCSGTDNHIFRNDPYFKVQFPAILGHEAIGRVIRCGTKVRNLKPKDILTRVFNKFPSDSNIHLKWGAFAEQGVVTDWQAMRDDGLHESQWSEFCVHRVLPSDFDPIASTLIITWRETYSFFKRLSLSVGQRALIVGSGAQALAFADHCRNTGVLFEVIGSTERGQLFREKGAVNFYDYRDSVAYPLNSKFDVIIDAIGKSAAVNKVINCLADNGAVAVYGLDQFLNYAIDEDKAPKHFTTLSGEEYEEASAHEDVISFIKAGKLNAWDYLSKDHIYPLGRTLEALEATAERKVLKSVIVP